MRSSRAFFPSCFNSCVYMCLMLALLELGCSAFGLPPEDKASTALYRLFIVVDLRLYMQGHRLGAWQVHKGKGSLAADSLFPDAIPF